MVSAAEKKKKLKEREAKLESKRSTLRETVTSSVNPNERIELVFVDELGKVDSGDVAIESGIIRKVMAADDNDEGVLGKRSREEAEEEEGVGSKQETRNHSEVAKNKQKKLTPEELKRSIRDRFGEVKGVLRMWPKVEKHDGNAPDPVFNVFLKTVPNSVRVPRHWEQLRSYLSEIKDRESADHCVSDEIESTNVRALRENKNTNPDIAAFARCFLTANPRQHHKFGVRLLTQGETHRDSIWRPRREYNAGEISDKLRKALGIGDSSPPPWLYSLQKMARLPPSYPDLLIPGMNAPIPSGAKWGYGEGMWGEPPHNEKGDFLFPAVRDHSYVAPPPPLYWGQFRRRMDSENDAREQATTSPAPAATPSPPPPAQKVPFVVPQQRPPPLPPNAMQQPPAPPKLPVMLAEEFVRVMVDQPSSGIISSTSMLQSKTATASAHNRKVASGPTQAQLKQHATVKF